MKKFKTVSELAAGVAEDPTLAAELQKDPVKTISSVASPAFINDVWIYRMVVVALGLAVLIVVIGAIFLGAKGTTENPFEIPQVLVALGSAAIGALAGLLAPSPVS